MNILLLLVITAVSLGLFGTGVYGVYCAANKADDFLYIKFGPAIDGKVEIIAFVLMIASLVALGLTLLATMWVSAVISAYVAFFFLILSGILD
ncbi:MAG TPA: hypothetical protein VFA15_01315 [Nitrososphaera sp.]|nr:hypothetical protein [Nitrososphaera sp.]